MANSMASFEMSSSSQLQDIVEFLQGIDILVELLKSKINSLSARYPVTAQEKRLNQLVEKIQQDIQERINMEKRSRETPPLEKTLTLSPSESIVESIPTPPQETTYPVVIYNNSCLRRRTVDQAGKLDQTLPRKKKVKVNGIKVETLTNDRYDPKKRADKWVEEMISFQQDNRSTTESEKDCENEDVLPKAQAIIFDIGKISLKNNTMPFFFFENGIFDDLISGVTRERSSLSSKEYAHLRECDPNKRLEMALKVAAANYEYWSSVYYNGLRNKKDPMQQTLVKEYLRHYIKDPLNSKGLIFYYQVQKASHNQELQCQAYIGKCEGSLVEKLREIHEDNNERSLLKLALRSKHMYSESNEMGIIMEKDVVLVLDFGYTEEFVEKYKDRLDKGDRLPVLHKNYIEYFGTRSPIGLN